MVGKKILGIVLVFSIVAAISIVGCAQQQMQTQQAASAAPEGPKITIKGKIDYWKNINDYVVIGEEPPRTYYIVNQDPKIMEEFFKSKKTIIIEGRRTTGADNIFIEKIDGQPYQGAKIQK